MKFTLLTLPCVLIAVLAESSLSPVWARVISALDRPATVDELLASHGTEIRTAIIPYFDEAGMVYPPGRLTLLAIKNTATLEVWAGSISRPAYIRSYKIQALSGISGPKLREGDKQVPEGIYAVQGLNPTSSYHLSIKLNYPNRFDQTYARLENRRNPGGEIFIHGKARSIGCLAMGDKTIEELFVTIADVGKENISVIIAPSDPRLEKLHPPAAPVWVAELYRNISNEFARYIRQEPDR